MYSETVLCMPQKEEKKKRRRETVLCQKHALFIIKQN
jgi:hypothetical protein